MSIEEEIRRIEEEIARTPYNKATQKHIGMLKAKLAKLRESQNLERKKKSSGGTGYAVRKSGDATVLLVGFPSVGKSTLLNRLTNAESRVGHYDFTTLDVIPGMMEYNGAKIQILDVPGIVEGASSGRGRGKEILSVVRNADLIVMLVDAREPEQIEKIRKELYLGGFRLDKKPPDVRIEKRDGGGIEIGSAVKLTRLGTEEIQSILREFKILNAEVVIREDVTAEDLIDCIMGNRVYVPSIAVFNKIDLLDKQSLENLKEKYRDCIFISAEMNENLDELRKRIWDKLCLMRIYLKKIGKEPDMDEPLIVKKGSTVMDIARKIHSEAFGERLKYARIWGKSAKFPGQKKGPEHVLEDGDIVELHMD